MPKPDDAISVLDFVTPEQLAAWERGEVIDIRPALGKAMAVAQKIYIPEGEFTSCQD